MWAKWKAKDDTRNFCEMLQVNLHSLQLFQNFMTAMHGHIKPMHGTATFFSDESMHIFKVRCCAVMQILTP